MLCGFFLSIDFCGRTHPLSYKVFAARQIQCLGRHGLSGSLRIEPLPLKDGKATASSAAAAGAGKTHEAYGFTEECEERGKHVVIQIIG